MGSIIFFLMPMEPVGRVLPVARCRLECGELVLTQVSNGFPEFIVDLYFRPRGSDLWAIYAIETDSAYWRGELLETNGGRSAVLTYYNTVAGGFSCADRTFKRTHGGSRSAIYGVSSLPQDYSDLTLVPLPVGWAQDDSRSGD